MTEPPNSDQLPPYDERAEAGCLSCILQASDEAGREWLSLLSIESFYDLRHQEIYRALTCINGGQELNGVTLHTWLRDKNRIEDAGGQAYVMELPDKAFSAGLWPSYFESVENFRIRRAVIRDAIELRQIAENSAISPAVIADAARRVGNEYSQIVKSKTLSAQTPDVFDVMEFDESDRIIGDRILSRGQSLVIAGSGGIGKTRISFQLAACCVSGIPFFGLETRGANLKFLFLQAENSNRRLKTDMQMLKDWLNPLAWERFCKQVLIHTLENEVDYYMSLESAEACERIIALIKTFKPDVIVWDSLYNYAIGDLNTDEGMSNTLLALSRVSKAGNINVSNIVLHHALTGKIGAARAVGFDRASFGRNSKVLYNWTRAQINIAPGSSENNEQLVVSCGKCSDGQEFPTFSVRLNPMTMIYETDNSFDFTSWQEELSGKTPSGMTLNRVKELCRFPLTKKELCKLIRDDCGCSVATSYRWISRAEKGGLLRFNADANTYGAIS